MIPLKTRFPKSSVSGALALSLMVSLLWVALARGQANQASTTAPKIKYVYSVDYPVGKKGEYLEWVKSIADILQAPVEVKRITPYDNYFGVSPHRFIEWEFESLADAAKYFERTEIKRAFEDVISHGMTQSVHVLALRGDYQKRSGQSAMSNKVKYLISVDYPLGQRAQYLEWVKSIADVLQAPAELKRLASYDNYFGTSPNRIIEWEFDNLADATKYFERPEIRTIFEDVINHGMTRSVNILTLRGDYNKQFTQK